MTFTDSISTEIAGGYAIYREFRAEDCGYNIAHDPGHYGDRYGLPLS